MKEESREKTCAMENQCAKLAEMVQYYKSEHNDINEPIIKYGMQ